VVIAVVFELAAALAELWAVRHPGWACYWNSVTPGGNGLETKG
jgi:hypothetical protein